jgi:hypothetical protein
MGWAMEFHIKMAEDGKIAISFSIATTKRAFISGFVVLFLVLGGSPQLIEKVEMIAKVFAANSAKK